MPNQLTITIARDGYVSVEALREMLEKALDMLRGLEQDFVSAGGTVRWEVVKVRMRSPLTLTIAPHIEGQKRPGIVGQKIVQSCVNGMERIERGTDRPEHFNEEALQGAKGLLKAVRKEGAAMTLSVNGKDKVAVTETAAQNIDIIVSRARLYTDVGTIEGRLEEISVHGEPHFRIWDPIPTEHAVRCSITPERLPEIKELLGRRVGVTGPIHYKNHKPQYIEVQRIRAFPPDSELPQLEDMEPIDITGGLSSEEYIRRMRDA